MRILVAGLGAIGQRHARNLRSLRGKGLELLAYRRRRLQHVVTESLMRDDSRNVEEELGITAFADLDDALQARPDAVFVCTPSSQHLEIALPAADAGCHLFIEKPVSDTLDGLRRLRSTVASKNLVAFVGCQWRFHPCVRWLRERIEAGSLGRLLHAEMEYSEYLPDWHSYEDYRESYAARAALGGGVVLTQIHDYDLAWWLFGKPRTVTATGGHLSSLQIDVEDTVAARLEGGSVPVSVRQTFASKLRRRDIAVTGDSGSVMLDLLTARVTAEGVSSVPDLLTYQRNQMFLDETAHFLACVEGSEKSAIPLDDGIAVLGVALAVKEAMRTGQAVALSDGDLQ